MDWATDGPLDESSGARDVLLDLDLRRCGRMRRSLQEVLRTAIQEGTGTAIDRYLRARRRHPRAPEPLLCLGDRGKGPITSDGVYRVLWRRGAAVGLPDLHPHQFRTPFAGKCESAQHFDRGAGIATGNQHNDDAPQHRSGIMHLPARHSGPAPANRTSVRPMRPASSRTATMPLRLVTRLPSASSRPDHLLRCTRKVHSPILACGSRQAAFFHVRVLASPYRLQTRAA
jgi:hypothetical protein